MYANDWTNFTETTRLVQMISIQLSPRYWKIFRSYYCVRCSISLYNEELIYVTEKMALITKHKNYVSYEIKNYRTLSLTSILCKFIENVIRGHIWLGGWCSSKHGFSKNFTQLLVRGSYSKCMSLGFSGASFSVCHRLLIIRLALFEIDG